MPTAWYTDELNDFYSSNLEAVYYDNLSQNLYVAFLSGSIVGYRNVPRSAYEAIKAAESKGAAYNAHVKGKYHGIGYDVTWDDFKVRHPAENALDAINQGAQAYEITAVVKIVRKVAAPTMEQAIEQFRADNPGSTVTEVTVKFV